LCLLARGSDMRRACSVTSGQAEEQPQKPGAPFRSWWGRPRVCYCLGQQWWVNPNRASQSAGEHRSRLENRKEKLLERSFRRDWECVQLRPRTQECYWVAGLLKAHPSGYLRPGAAWKLHKKFPGTQGQRESW